MLNKETKDFITNAVGKMGYDASVSFKNDNYINYEDRDCSLEIHLASGKINMINAVKKTSSTFDMESLRGIERNFAKLAQQLYELKESSIKMFSAEHVYKIDIFCEARTKEEAEIKFKKWLSKNKRGHGYFSAEYINTIKETRFADREAVEHEQKSTHYTTKSLII